MKTQDAPQYESDKISSREVIQRYRDVIYDDDRNENLSLVHNRGGKEEFCIGKEYCVSDDARDRATGADVLAQLGWRDKAFQDEIVSILTHMLNDVDSYVVYCAAVGLGHRDAKCAIPELVKQADSPAAIVRQGVAFGLLGHEECDAVESLIRLMKDEDRDVRNWAVFGIGSQIDIDTPQIREALKDSLSDADHEIRGEALVGLALRKDPSVVQALLHEWRNDEVSILSIEAAEESADSRLYERLKSFTDFITLDDDPSFAGWLEEAIEACKPKQ